MPSQYCLADLPDYLRDECPTYKFGGSDAIALLKKGHGITDLTSQAEWEAALAADEARILSGIKGEFPQGTATETENPTGCGNETILGGFDFLFNLQDANVNATNDAFYAGVNGNSYELVWYECEEDEIRHVDRDVTVSMAPAILPVSNKELQKYLGNLKFSAPPDWTPTRYDAPPTIFTQ